jgi:predicted nucleic acid-binding protein
VTPLFVDTSAFFALVDHDDRNHVAAKRCLRVVAKEKRPLVTSTYVLDEVFTLTRMRLGHPAAVALGTKLEQTRWCRVVDVSDEVRAAAWQLFVRYHDQTFSFTDCTSFALMRSMQLLEAFTFDRKDFAAAGLSPLPG